MRALRRVAAICFMLSAILPAPATAFQCKLALVLGLDISSSVNDREYRLQLDGLAAALETEQVIEAILSPEGVGIAALAYEWSGYNQQDLITGWRALDTEAAIRAFAGELRAHRRYYTDFPTAVGKSLEFAAGLFQSAPPCQRRVIDLSGDGENNDGPRPAEFRARGLLDGITINALVILGAYPDPAVYYREHVIQGPDAFVAIARDFDDYRAAMVSKLLREIGQELILGRAEGGD